MLKVFSSYIVFITGIFSILLTEVLKNSWAVFTKLFYNKFAFIVSVGFQKTNLKTLSNPCLDTLALTDRKKFVSSFSTSLSLI